MTDREADGSGRVMGAAPMAGEGFKLSRTTLSGACERCGGGHTVTWRMSAWHIFHSGHEHLRPEPARRGVMSSLVWTYLLFMSWKMVRLSNRSMWMSCGSGVPRGTGA